VNRDNILYKCGWSPFVGTTFKSKIVHTIVSGNLVYTEGKLTENSIGKRMAFDRG
jgi:dihydroorotase